MGKDPEPAENPWKVTAHSLMYENPWIAVTEHQVIHPSGNPGIYGTVHFKNLAIGILPLDEENNTWIVGQYRFPLAQYSWEIIEGGGPLGIDPLTSAKRELLEEAGVIAEHWELLLEADLSNSVTDEKAMIFVARGLSFTRPDPEESEVLQLKKVSLQELQEMAINGEIRDALTLMAVLKFTAIVHK